MGRAKNKNISYWLEQDSKPLPYTFSYTICGSLTYKTRFLFCRKALRNAQLEGISFGISEAFMFLANAVAFKYGGYLVVEGEMTFNKVMK